MGQEKEREPGGPSDQSAIQPSEKDGDRCPLLTPIQQAAYSAAIFGPSSSD